MTSFPALFDHMDWADQRALAESENSLTRVVEYCNSAGQAFSNTVADMLTQVVLHGSYHRGQLALLARQGGGTPAATDYILHARGRGSTR